MVIGNPGLGREIVFYQAAGDWVGVYSLVIVTGLLGLVINLVFRFIERRSLVLAPVGARGGSAVTLYTSTVRRARASAPQSWKRTLGENIAYAIGLPFLLLVWGSLGDRRTRAVLPRPVDDFDSSPCFCSAATCSADLTDSTRQRRQNWRARPSGAPERMLPSASFRPGDTASAAAISSADAPATIGPWSFCA